MTPSNQPDLGILLAQIFGSPLPGAERRTIDVHPETLEQMLLLGLVDLVNDGSTSFYTYCGYPLISNPFAERIDVDPATLFSELVDGSRPCSCPPGECLGEAFEPYEIGVAGDAAPEMVEPEILDAEFTELEPLQRFPKRELLADLTRAAGSLSAAMLVIAEQVELLEGDE